MGKKTKIAIIVLIALIIYGLFNLLTYEPKQQEIISPIPKSERVPTPTPKRDTRIDAVHDFFAHYNSPLAEDAQTFVQVADEVQIDYRILPAIAMVESTGGKFTPSCAPYNVFGWTSLTSPCGFYRFSSYSEGIRIVAQKITGDNAYADFRATGSASELAKVYNVRPDDWSAKLSYFMGRIK